jgi:hypothetical protein
MRDKEKNHLDIFSKNFNPSIPPSLRLRAGSLPSGSGGECSPRGTIATDLHIFDILDDRGWCE